MSIFVKNVNEYLTQLKIKQNFISMRTGIDTSKLSRLLKEGGQDITETEMERISAALGKKPEFFMNEDFVAPQEKRTEQTEVVFYAGEPGKEQSSFARKVMELIACSDEILGVKGRLIKAMKG